MVRGTFQGAAILSGLYQPVAGMLDTVLVHSHAKKSTKEIEQAMAAFVATQPTCVRSSAKRLLSRISELTVHDVSARFVDLARSSVLHRALRRPCAFVLPSLASSATLAFLLLLHALVKGSSPPSLGRTRRKCSKALGDLVKHCVVIVVSDLDPRRDIPGLAWPSDAILVEDALYTGGAARRTLADCEALLRANFSRVLVLAAYGRAEEMEYLAHDIGMDRCVLHIGAALRTMFHGLSRARVIMLDAYLIDKDGTCCSYLFDVLKLDDRHGIDLLAHKTTDMTMAPHTLLNATPAFPRNVVVYKVRNVLAAHALAASIAVPTRHFAQHAFIAASITAANDYSDYSDYLTRVECSEASATPETPGSPYAQLLARFGA
jgi:hypothetical protein